MKSFRAESLNIGDLLIKKHYDSPVLVGLVTKKSLFVEVFWNDGSKIQYHPDSFFSSGLAIQYDRIHVNPVVAAPASETSWIATGFVGSLDNDYKLVKGKSKCQHP